MDNKLNNQNKHDSSPSKGTHKSIFIGMEKVSPKSRCLSVEDTKEDISKNLVLPLVNYEWIDVAPSKPPLYVKHLKRFIKFLRKPISMLPSLFLQIHQFLQLEDREAEAKYSFCR